MYLCSFLYLEVHVIACSNGGVLWSHVVECPFTANKYTVDARRTCIYLHGLEYQFYAKIARALISKHHFSYLHNPQFFFFFPSSLTIFQMASIPGKGSASIQKKPLEDSGVATIASVCLLPDSTNPPPEKRHKPTPSFAKIRIPKTSAFKVFSDEEIQRATALDNSFITTFEEKCLVGMPVLRKFDRSFPVDIWREILDHARSNTFQKSAAQAFHAEIL